MAVSDDVLIGLNDALTEVGYNRTLKRRTLTTPTNLTKSPVSTTTSYTIRTIMTDYKDYYVNGTTIKQGDRECIIGLSGLAITPAKDDIIIDGTTEYTIVDLDLPEVNGVKVVAIAQLRK